MIGSALILTMESGRDCSCRNWGYAPYPTDAEFKQGKFLQWIVVDPMSNPSRAKNMSQKMLLRWAESMPASSDENLPLFQQGRNASESRSLTVQTLDCWIPFAWSQFIRSIKREILKRKEIIFLKNMLLVRWLFARGRTQRATDLFFWSVSE